VGDRVLCVELGESTSVISGSIAGTFLGGVMAGLVDEEGGFGHGFKGC